ncbi:hypothetical protein MM300_13925 [Evansella sp. LMS18]|uniref:hypothetical protein n=1 Tax=Evansella sp. LMS18 TaxID=2924033 RepID=UPI0020D1AC8E|nr:hypothetical protein [Evansella sp. LMS18]UTR09021.1 hypothetical protein MM300_13925 [Evansella sp. LMS18]
MTTNKPPAGNIDWDNFQNIFKNKNFMNNPFYGMSAKDPKWIEEYVHNILSQAVPDMNREGAQQPPSPAQPHPPAQQGHPPAKQQAIQLQKELFEGHYHIIVRVLLPPHVHPKQLRLLHAANQLRIEGLPNQGPEIIELPCLGITQGAAAVVKNQILEVNIPKETQYNFGDIPLSYE